MDPTCILMCANIPRGIPEDVLLELFCIAGPVEDVSLSRSGRSCFVIYEFPESVHTAKEIFKDVKLFNRPLEMLDQNDIKQIHEKQEQESADMQKQAAYAEMPNQHNPFYNPDSMTPTFRHNAHGHSRNFPAPQNLFSPAQSHFNGYPVQFNSYPVQFNSPQNHYGDNYDPSVPTRRWNSTPETNQSPSIPSPLELDLFKSPYSQPVSRKSYEQSRKDYYDDGASNSNYQDRSNCYSKRHPTKFSTSDSSTEPPVHKKFKDQNTEEVHLFKDTIAEYAYEKQTRQQFFDHNKKSYRDNDRYHSNNNAASNSSDYSNRHKSRNYDRSPYSRNDYKRNEQHDSRRSDHYHDKGQRNRRR